MKRIGMMLDCSRNAVKTVEEIKHIIDVLKKCNYNQILLYIEDTFELDGEPYFGYLRGRYTKEELKEIDRYAVSQGFEVVPCIQTLAHLNQIFRWNAYTDINDLSDVLLCGNDKTYNLINKMFDTVAECFSSNKVNIGMDEAYLVGYGKYRGDKTEIIQSDVFINHVNKVYELAKKHGLECLMWSDMFYRVCSNGKYYFEPKVEFKKELVEKLPKDITLIYWDYYHYKSSDYEKMYNCHKQFSNKIAFAGGIWSWSGFVPQNKYALSVITPAIKMIAENNIDEVFFTAWQDNGAECPFFASLPSIFYAGMKTSNPNLTMSEIKELFYKSFNIKFDDYMKLDLPNQLTKDKGLFNPSKYLLFNDPFLGICDSTIMGNESELYKAKSRILKKLSNKMNEFSYISKFYASLCKALEYKADLGFKTRKLYKENDKEGLKQLLKQYDLSIKYIKIALNDFRIAWYEQNKSFGFEVQEIRFGGLIERLLSCKKRLVEFIEGKLEKIEELEQVILNVEGEFKNAIKGKPTIINNYQFNASTCII